MNDENEKWLIDLAAGIAANVIRREDGDIIDIILDGVSRAYLRGYDYGFIDDWDNTLRDGLDDNED